MMLWEGCYGVEGVVELFLGIDDVGDEVYCWMCFVLDCCGDGFFGFVVFNVGVGVFGFVVSI